LILGFLLDFFNILSKADAIKQWISIALSFISTAGFQIQKRPIHVFMIGDSTMADKNPKAEQQQPESVGGLKCPDDQAGVRLSPLDFRLSTGAKMPNTCRSM
jgi:hypothetical protein